MKPNPSRLLKLLDPRGESGRVMQLHGDVLLVTDFYGIYALDPDVLSGWDIQRPPTDHVIRFPSYEGMPDYNRNILGNLWDTTWDAATAPLTLTPVRMYRAAGCARVLTRDGAPRKQPVLLLEEFLHPVLASVGAPAAFPEAVTFTTSDAKRYAAVGIKAGHDRLGTERRVALIMPMTMDRHSGEESVIRQTLQMVAR